MDRKLIFASMTMFFLVMQFGDVSPTENQENPDLMVQNDDLMDDLDEEDVAEATEYKRSTDGKKKIDAKKWREDFIKDLDKEFKKKATEIADDATKAALKKIREARSGKTRRGVIPQFRI